jgi:hypothetical protein
MGGMPPENICGTLDISKKVLGKRAQPLDGDLQFNLMTVSARLASNTIMVS